MGEAEPVGLPVGPNVGQHVTLEILQFVVLTMHARFGNKQNACGKHFSGVCPLRRVGERREGKSCARSAKLFG